LKEKEEIISNEIINEILNNMFKNIQKRLLELNDESQFVTHKKKQWRILSTLFFAVNRGNEEIVNLLILNISILSKYFQWKPNLTRAIKCAERLKKDNILKLLSQVNLTSK
jgi:hypothetical protein